MKRIPMLALPVLLLGVSAASATDLFLPAPDLEYGAPVYASSGWYAGATLGAHKVDINIDGADGTDGTGTLGGGFIGWSTPMGGANVGFEADIEATSFRKSLPCNNVDWTCEGYVNGMGSLRGRLGVSFDAFSVYGTAGLALGSVGGSTTYNADGDTYPAHQFRLGWTAGAGIEANFSDHWFGRLEYRYTDYGSADVLFDEVYPAVAINSHAIRIGAGYRF